MVIIPNKFIFTATPRTGSRAISEALLRKYPEALSDYPSKHHDHPTTNLELPVYTVIRNPLDQLLSWWAHVDIRAGSPRRPLQFAEEYENVMFLPKYEKYRLNIHADIADKFLLYSNNMYHITKELDIHDLVRVGRSPSIPATNTEKAELKEYIESEFAADLALWSKVFIEEMLRG